MNWPELTPKEAPLECFALEYNGADPTCLACPHVAECKRHMLSRLDRIPLSKASYRVLPEAYDVRFNIDADDPEAPEIQRVYILCYETVFGKKPHDYNVGKHAAQIVELARRADCSLRLFMLANMVGHQRMQKEIIAKTALAKTKPFRVYLLTEDKALERARLYAELCRKEFGTFTLGSLSAMSETSYEDNDLDTRLLNSEVTAGRWLVGHKIIHEGPPYELFYECEEMNLDPHWLAMDDNYHALVLKDEKKRNRGSQELRRHRYAVVQAIGFLKRHRNVAITTFRARQRILPQAVSRVLEHFGYKPDDFEVKDEPITNPMELYVLLGRAIQHFNLLAYLHGEKSLFNR